MVRERVPKAAIFRFRDVAGRDPPTEVRPSANDKYFRVRARMFASDFEPCAVKSSLEKTAFPGRGSVIYPQQKTAILKIARRRRKILRI